MTRIPPIPTSRIPGLLARQRLTQQYQTDQLDLFRLQEQISTGLRITLPSEDPHSALRAISFQRLLSRKEQLGSNIQNGLLFLGNTDSTLGGAEGVADVLSKIKADTLGVIGTVATDQQRETAISDINGALESLVNLGNRQFNGRYLFAGSQTNEVPYTLENGNVIYHGDDREIRNYSDIGVLFSSSISGQEVFGGISAAVEGTEDLNPSLHGNTLLSSLRGGRGINPNGSLQISADGSNVSIVDLSSATTVGDVVRLIEDNAPTGTNIDVSITADGLRVELDSGILTIDEVGTGTTARELGILSTGTGSPSTITSEDLKPVLLKTTRLEDLLGSKARASLVSTGDNNDILIEALQNGTTLNGVTIQIIDGGDIGATATASLVGSTLEIRIDDDGETTASHVVDAINLDGNFSAVLDPGDTTSTIEEGSGPLTVGTFPNQTADGSGTTFDQTAGIRIVNGGETYDITFAADETVEDLLNRLNRSEAGVFAEINASGTGINIRSRLSGNDFSIGELGGTTATQLGIRTNTGDSLLKDFNFGVGVPTFGGFDIPTGNGTDFTIDTVDGIQFDVDLSNIDFSGLSTNDAITAIVNEINAASAGAAANVTASAVAAGNVTVVQLDDAGVGADPFTISQGPGSLAAKYLGLIPDDGTSTSLTAPGTTIVGGNDRYVDLTVTDSDGTSYDVDLSTAVTVDDVLTAINNATGGVVVAQLATVGNGIELVDTSAGAGSLTVSSANGSKAAEFLGLVPQGQTSNSNATGTLAGTDRNTLETSSVFTSLIRLRDALEAGDLPATERAAALLEQDIERVTFAQADVGTRFRNLELSQFHLQDEEIQIRSALSEEIDVDLVEAISQMTARQISLEASLRATANILQLSLLNFI